jgi:type III pantothenate kinase
MRYSAQNSKVAMSILILDIGNTRLKWGLFEGAGFGAKQLAAGACVLEDIEPVAGPALMALPKPDRIVGCVVAGEVVKRRVAGIMYPWNLKPQWIISQKEQCGVTSSYEFPWLLGSDRWAALIGAHAHQQDAPMLAVMVGTAVTVDCLDRDGRFLGGSILPGYGLMLRGLEMGTAGLRVPNGEMRDFPHFPVNTSDALMTGGTDAIAGAVERMYRRLNRVTGMAPDLILAGGASAKLSPMLDVPHTQIEHLVFDGLLEIAASTPANLPPR